MKLKTLLTAVVAVSITGCASLLDLPMVYKAQYDYSNVGNINNVKHVQENKQPAQATVKTTPKTKVVKGVKMTLIGYAKDGSPIYVNSSSVQTSVKKKEQENVKPKTTAQSNSSKKQSIEDAIKQAIDAATPAKK